MRHLYLKRIATLLVGLLIVASSVVFADSSPVTLLQSLADRMISELKSHQASLKSNPSVVYSIANRIVVPHADIDEMAKRVLPAKAWEQATPDQRSKFKREFITVLERTYANALAEYTDETIKFFPVRGGVEGQSSVTVKSQVVRSDGPSISVDYQMIRTGSSWMLLDITVEGVSMLQSFRSQFSDELSRGDMNSVISALSGHNRKNGG